VPDVIPSSKKLALHYLYGDMMHLSVRAARGLCTRVRDAILDDLAQCAPEDIDSRHQSRAEEDIVQTRSKFIQDPRWYNVPLECC